MPFLKRAYGGCKPAGRNASKKGNTMNKVITDTMRICSKYARCVPCKRCLHFQDCARVGLPCSTFGLYMAWLTRDVLPPIEAELRKYCVKGLKLEAHAPEIDELEEGAYAVVRAYDETKNKRLIFRLNLQGEEDEAALRTLVFNAHIQAKRKNNNGK